MSDPIRLFYVTCGYRCGNAGDQFSRDIVAKLSGRPVVQVEEAKDADLIAAGSVAHHIPHDYAGAIWGSGVMFEHGRPATPRARVTALRGHMSVRRWEEIGPVVVGDPGLLVRDVYPVELKPRYAVGLIPHYVDGENEEVRSWATAFRGLVTVLDVCQPVGDLVRAMGECAYILSSSLHGLVFADALGIPNEWVSLSDKLSGGTFKFHDYYSAFGIDPLARSFGPTTNPRDIVSRAHQYSRPGLADIQRRLREAFPCG